MHARDHLSVCAHQPFPGLWVVPTWLITGTWSGWWSCGSCRYLLCWAMVSWGLGVVCTIM